MTVLDFPVDKPVATEVTPMADGVELDPVVKGLISVVVEILADIVEL